MSRPVALISGGTSGLGRSVTTSLAERGYDVVAFGVEPEAPSLGDEALFLTADTAEEAEVQRVVDTALAKYGRIDALVVNAAIGPLGTVLDTAPELWDRILGVNLRGAYLLARAVIPHLKKNGGGAIVFVGSGAGWGKPNMAAYAASKGGLTALAQSLAYDHFHDHVRVNMVVPGGGGILGGISLARVGGDAARLAASPGTVAGRPTNGQDLAHAIAFLLSDEAAAISGTIVDVGCFFHQGGPVPLPSNATENDG